MSKFIEILAMALGGLSLFAVCFFGFAVAGGQSPSQIPGIGKLFPEPETVVEEAAQEEADGSSEAPRPRRSDQDVVSAGIGVMGAWSLPSPFTQAELKTLADELKSTKLTLEERERSILAREQEVADKLDSINERFDVLEKMRADLEAFESELDLREQEVLRDEGAQAQRIGQTWADRAAVFDLLEEKEAGQKLLEYTPEEAAQILRAMDKTKAVQILNSIPQRFKEYLDAYASLSV